MPPSDPLLPDLVSPAQAILDLCLKANGLYSTSNSNEAEALAVLRVLDVQGLIDWRTPLSTGHPLLTSLAIEGKTPPGLMAWMAMHHAPEIDELLTQVSSGTPAHALLWQSHVAHLKAVKSGKSYFGTRTDTVQEWVNQLPLEALSWRDAPGDTPGAGWLTSALRQGQNEVAQALADRGVDWTGRHKGVPVALHLCTPEQWDAFLAQGGNPHTKGLFPDQPDLVLWEALVRRGKTEMPLLNRVLAWAAEAKEPQAAEAAYWAHLRRVVDNGDAIKGKLLARPDWETARDHRGVPALWVAVKRNPALLRLVTEKQDRKGVLTARDHQGRGFWYHCSFLLDSRTFTPKLVSELRQKAPILDTTLDGEGRGLVAQWLLGHPRHGSWFPPLSRSSEDAANQMVRDWPLPLLWARHPEDEAPMARALLESPGNDTTHLASWLMHGHLLSRDQRRLKGSGSWSGPEWVPSFELEDLIGDCSPELRMALSLTAVLVVVRQQAFEKETLVFLQHMEEAGIVWPAGVSPEPWCTALNNIIEARRKTNGTHYDSPLGRQFETRVRAWAQASQIAQALPPEDGGAQVLPRRNRL